MEGKGDPQQSSDIPQRDFHLEKGGGTRQSTQGTSRVFNLGWSGRRIQDLDGQSSGAFGAWIGKSLVPEKSFSPFPAQLSPLLI